MTPRQLGAFCFTVLALILPSKSQADLFVTSVVTPLAGSFHYEISIENTGPEDFVLVSLFDAPLADPLIDPSLLAPAGFQASYDGGLGIADFLEDTSLFAAGTLVSGFSFDSLSGPTVAFTTFEALDVNGGYTSGTVNVVAVPESTAAAEGIAFVLAGTAVFSRRFRNRHRFP